MSKWWNAIVLVACLVGLGACAGDDTIDMSTPDATPIPDATLDATVDAAPSLPDTGIGGDDLIIDRIVPPNGPYSGGTVSVIRGNGFTFDTFAFIGGRMVQPADTEMIDSHRLRVVVPAGEPGPADVTVRVGDTSSTLAGAFTYDAFSVSPTRGSVAGGTVLTLLSESMPFADGDTVMLGRTECTNVAVQTSSQLTCRTPPGTPGTVDVTVISGTDGSELVAANAYSFYDASDPVSGGLGGGPITGTINVTVIDPVFGMPVPDAYVIVGEDMDTFHQGLTDLMGQITFSGDDLLGDQTVHVAKDCYEKTSVVTFDASDVTVFLIPWTDDLRCFPPSSGSPPPSRGRSGAFISGELIWRGPNEHGPNPWSNIPEPRASEVRVAYVYTTQRCAGDSQSCLNPDPSLGGAIHRVIEVPPTEAGELGYPYRIFARPAGLAVYALAGLENATTGEFIPYVMGVARNVLAGPGEEVLGTDMYMDIPLDHTLNVRVNELPGEGRTGPDAFKVAAAVDLGGEGIIERMVSGEFLDIVRARTSEQLFRFWAQPAMLGALADGRYRIEGGWYTGSFDRSPMTVRVVTGIRDVDRPEIPLDDYIGLPVATAPAYDQPFPEDRVLRWERTGTAEADMHVVIMIGSDGNPAWRHLAPGNVFEAPVPDLSSIPGIPDVTEGSVIWAVYAIRIPDFDFDSFSYRYLNDRYWTAWATDTFRATR